MAFLESGFTLFFLLESSALTGFTVSIWWQIFCLFFFFLSLLLFGHVHIDILTVLRSLYYTPFNIVLDPL